MAAILTGPGRAVAACLLAAALAVAPSQSIAFEIPTTPANSWTASGVTTGTIPGSPAASPAETGSYYKTTPSGLRMTVTVDGVFPNGSSGAYFSSPANTSTTGLNPSAAGTNPGVFTTTPVMPAGTNPINILVSSDQCRLTSTALTTCTGLGTVRVQLTDPVGGLVPVVAPRIHVTRLGGTVGAMELATGLQINAAGSSGGIGFASTAAATATLAVTGGNEFFGNPNAVGTNLNVNCGVTATSTAGCGTVQVTGNAATVLMNVKSYRTSVAPNIWDNGGDAFFFDMSFDEDFGGAPNSYEGGGVAAAHLVTDLRLGSGVTAENSTTINGDATGASLLTVDPNAVAAGAAPGDTNDGVASLAAISTGNIGSTYTINATISGASRAGKACSWVDYNRDGLFTAAEGFCNTFAAGATTVAMTGTVPTAMSAGQTYARVRVSYDTTMSASSFNGLLSSGEVEDYQLNIMPAVKVVKALAPVSDTGTFNLSINGTNFATGVGNGGTTGFKTVYHTGTPDVTVATNVANAAITGVTLAEAAAGATNLTDYVTTAACVNATGAAVTPGGTATAPTVTIPQSLTGAAANGQAQTITCTLTNKRIGLTVVKAVNSASLSAPGTLTYTITVANTGAAPLTGIVTSDALTQGAAAKTLTSGPTLTSGDASNPGTFDAGETWTYTATYAVSQADIDNGGTFSNTFSFDTAQTSPQNSNAVTTTITQSASMTVVKAQSSGPNPVTASGQTIGYSITVKNTGNISLTSIVTTDALTQSAAALTLTTGPTLSSGDTDADNVLDVGETWVYAATYLVKGAQISDGSNLSNVATSDSDQTTAVTSAAVVTPISPGAVYTPPTAAAACTASFAQWHVLAPSGNPNSHDHGASWSTDMGFAQDANGIPVLRGTPDATGTAAYAGTTAPAITELETGIGPGEFLVIAYRVEGVPGASMSTVVRDPSGKREHGLYVVKNASGGVVLVEPASGVAPMFTASLTDTALSYTMPAEGYVNLYVYISDFNQDFMAHLPFCNGSMTVLKAASAPTIAAGTSAAITDVGDKVNYSYTVTNTGTVTLSGVVPVDAGPQFNGFAAGSTLSVFSPASATIAPGASQVFTASYTLTQPDIDKAAGITDAVTNSATASGTMPTAATVNAPASLAKTTIASNPDLTISKTADKAGPLVKGDVVTFSYLVKNTGNVTLSGVGITETAFNGTGGPGALTPAGGAATLAPGATTTFTATYTVTQNDVDLLQ